MPFIPIGDESLHDAEAREEGFDFLLRARRAADEERAGEDFDAARREVGVVADEFGAHGHAVHCDGGGAVADGGAVSVAGSTLSTIAVALLSCG